MEQYPRPRTISELLEFCNYHNMPLRTMRFFIGEDHPEPRAFGIFRAPDGDFVVYKNKDNGTRAVRYKGPDEAFAVNEIYEKLRSEVELRRNMNGQTGYNVSRSGGSGRTRTASKKSSVITWIITISVIALIVFFCVLLNSNGPKRGYYRNNDNYYYYDSSDWYYYNNGWMLLDDYGWLNDNYSDYYLSNDYDNGYAAGDFRQSEYYNENDNDDYDWGGGDDYGGWDAGATDWGTDW
ncbi:hypothetical protein SAMN02910317_02418 [Ruminococcaceae bacterium FB2012]|nr:hypothetical protein SAMN02910317_02418 [Ruminococcaceae bacterium FB2012]